MKLGTRRSLLAWAQSGWVAREIERLNPGTTVELVGIDTRGDLIQDVSLQSVAGKEFFVAELDTALKSGAVDLTVHSMKDLSLERPLEFVTAAVPRREDPRDVVIFGPGVDQALAEGRPLRIGTSSPRRLENIPGFLAKALPQAEHAPRVDFVEIRGNVNTRLGRVHEPSGSARALDGVVLAFAGLVRLFADDTARPELEKLRKGTRWMVLPLSESPTNPGQGALAVECRAQDAKTREAIGRLHHPETARHAGIERSLLAKWGGGCHQKFGATSVTHSELGDLIYVRGRIPSGESLNELQWSPRASATAGDSWDGSSIKAEVKELSVPAIISLRGKSVFVAHSRAVTANLVEPLREARVWTSGVTSWCALAKKGIWVEGCAESLGFDWAADRMVERALGHPPLDQWEVLTHLEASDEWRGRVASVHATYQVLPTPPDSQILTQLKGARHLFWSSGTQWDRLNTGVRSDAIQACGAGKTARYLRERGVQPLVFPSAKEWLRWLNAR